jgi:N-acetylmuramoyl-L-alanine amidase
MAMISPEQFPAAFFDACRAGGSAVHDSGWTDRNRTCIADGDVAAGRDHRGVCAAFGGLAVWGYFVLRIGNPGDGYVLRLALPDGSRGIGLPPVEGPADASRPLVVIDAGHGGHDPARAARARCAKRT